MFQKRSFMTQILLLFNCLKKGVFETESNMSFFGSFTQPVDEAFAINNQIQNENTFIDVG